MKPSDISQIDIFLILLVYLTFLKHLILFVLISYNKTLKSIDFIFVYICKNYLSS